MLLRDVVVAALDPQLVRLEQDVGVRVAVRRLETVRRELDQQPERVVEVDRVHEAAILGAGVADAALVEPLDDLPEGRLREREGEVVHRAGVAREPPGVGRPLLVREDGDEPSITRVEVQVTLGLVVEIRLLEHERHAEEALPEVDRRLPAGADDRDVVDALALDLPHRTPSVAVAVCGNPDSDRPGSVTYGVAMLLLVAATQRELCGHDGLVCGVGPVEAAVATARALALHRFDVVLHVGLAGARDLPVGSVVVGTESVYCDLSAEWPVVDRTTPDVGLVERVRAALPDAAVAPIHTSAAVGAASNTVSRGPLVEAMEGFGVLRAAERAGVPAVEVRVVSNEIGEEDRSRWQVDAALDALEEVLPKAVRAMVDVAASR